MAALELAELIYYQRVPQGSFKRPLDLYMQGIDVPQLALVKDFNNELPRSRVVELLMKGDGVKRDWKQASALATDIQQTDDLDIMNRTREEFSPNSDKVKDQMDVSPSMPKDRAIEKLLCEQPRNEYVDLFSVFGTVEAYGVPLEQALRRPCGIPSDKQTPLLKGADDVATGDSESYLWPRQVAMYLVFTRGDYKAFEALLKEPMHDGRTLSAQLSHLIDKRIGEIQAAEASFRRQYAASDASLRANIRFEYRDTGKVWQWIPDVPFHIVRVEGTEFSLCVGSDSSADTYTNIDRLPELYDHYLNKVGGIKGQLLASVVKTCLDEPNYKAKMRALAPYLSPVKAWSKAKNEQPFKELKGLGQALRSLCRFEGIYGDLPAHCRRNVAYEVNWLAYWSDNNRSGYRPIAVSEMTH